MAETTYNYTVSVDFSDGVDPALLKTEILASSITGTLVKILTDLDADDCDVTFADALSGPDQTTLNGLVAAHVPPTLYHARRAAVKIQDAVAQSFTLGSTWEVMGGVVMSPDVCVQDLTKTMLRIECCYNTNGVQADIRILEDGAQKATFALPDSSSADALLRWDAEFTAGAGARAYKIEGRQGTATACTIGMCSVELCEKI